MARSKIKDKKVKPIQIGGSESSSSSSSIKTKRSVKKPSTGRGSGMSKKPRSEKQRVSSIANLEKARQAKKNYEFLRKGGFTNETILDATRVIDNYLSQADSMRSSENPAVARLFDEIGGAFKSEEEIAKMSKGEFYKYATSIREFLNNPISSEEAANYLQNSLRSGLIKAELVKSANESDEQYKARRKQFIQDREELSKVSFRIYRKVMETNAGQIIKAKMSPAAYGSDNLIADIFDFVTGGYWTDRDEDAARAYWEDLIEQQYERNLQELQLSHSREAIEISNFSWRGVMAYDSFVQSRRKQ